MAKKKTRKPPPPALLLRCGCQVRFVDGKAPMCPRHGNQVVARVLNMRKPVFRGHCTGPLAQPEDLPAFTGRIAGSEAKT